jgi:ATP-dependent Clp protease protease subunit
MRPTNSPRVYAQTVWAMAKPSKIALPARQDVAALAKPEAFDRWKAGIRSAGEIGKNVITMFDVIGEDFWSGTGVTVKRVDAALRQIGNQDVEVHINSPGGDMFEGIAILNRLLEHPAKVTVKVLGLAASAASIIAMAGEERLMAPSSFIMIHNCWVVAIGNRHDLADTSTWLQPFDDAMNAVYAERTGLDAKAIAKMMDAESWLNGNQALANGFATGLLSADDLKEDEATSQDAAASNAVRQAELGLCRSMSRSDARALISKIKGTPGAAQEPAVTPGADDDLSWLGQAAGLSSLFRS